MRCKIGCLGGCYLRYSGLPLRQMIEQCYLRECNCSSQAQAPVAPGGVGVTPQTTVLAQTTTLINAGAGARCDIHCSKSCLEYSFYLPKSLIDTCLADCGCTEAPPIAPASPGMCQKSCRRGCLKTMSTVNQTKDCLVDCGCTGSNWGGFSNSLFLDFAVRQTGGVAAREAYAAA